MNDDLFFIFRIGEEQIYFERVGRRLYRNALQFFFSFQSIQITFLPVRVCRTTFKIYSLKDVRGVASCCMLDLLS